MAWEYADLFDAKVGTHVGSLMEDYWKNIPTEIRVGAMGYRTRTTKAGTRLEAEIYPIFGREKTGILKAARKSITPERVKRQNWKRSEHRLVLLVEENFRADRDIHISLTYEGTEPDMQRCRKDIKNYLSRVRRAREKKGLPELKYIYAIGLDADTRIHAHMIMSGGMGRKELEKIWGKGYANSFELQDYGNGLIGMAKYLYQQTDERRKTAGAMPYIRSWAGSKNLIKPKTRTSDSKVSRRRVRILAQDFQCEAKDIMEKLYPGYVLKTCEVFYSDIVDGVYIRAEMRSLVEYNDGSARKGA